MRFKRVITTGLLVMCLTLSGSTLMTMSCTSNPGAFFLEDYQRDLLLGGLLAAVLLRPDTSGDGTNTDDGAGQPIPGPEGPQGPAGPAGEDGQDGQDGQDGADGAVGPVGSAGPVGAEGSAGPVGPVGPAGPAGEDGSDGRDGRDGQDGADGADGPSFFDIFIDDFFAPVDALTGDLTLELVRVEEPVLGDVNFETGRTGVAIAYRVAVPERYVEGNDVTMRLFFHRTGTPPEDCFVMKVDRGRLRDGHDVELYEDPRWVAFDVANEAKALPASSALDLLLNGGDGKFFVIDLPVNRGTADEDGNMDGLGFWRNNEDPLKTRDMIAFELGVDQEDLVNKYIGVQYHLLGAEFFESPTGSSLLKGARISTEKIESCVSGCPQPRTYTTNSHFDEGSLLNVNHEVSGQLQLNAEAEPFPFVWIAASARGTIIKINTDTGDILGEYLSAPNGRGRNPSRTTVDLFGSVWAANRDESEGGNGSLVHIALAETGRCVDRNGNGVIETSSGLGDILPWTNPGGVDDQGGVSSAEDECIIHYTRVTGSGTRTVAIDANNDVWVGGLNDQDHEQIDGQTGLPVPATQFNLGCGGYGGFIDGAGILWSARGGSGSRILRFDPATMTGTCLDAFFDNYGLGLDPQTGHVWATTLSQGVVHEIAPDGTLLNTYSHGSGSAQGVVVDNVGNVWVAHSLFSATTVGHLRTDGTFVGNVSLPGGNGPTGVAVDSNGKVWVANINTNNAQRIDPSAGEIGGGGFPIGAVDLTVDLGAGAGPYNYSDMTGIVALQSVQQGRWTVVYDGLVEGAAWGVLNWNREDCVDVHEPEGTSLVVAVRASDTEAGLGSESYHVVGNGVPFSGVSGRYIQVEVTFNGSGTGEGFVTPVLCDLTVQADCDGPSDCVCHPDIVVSCEEDPAANRGVGAVVDYDLPLADEECLIVCLEPDNGPRVLSRPVAEPNLSDPTVGTSDYISDLVSTVKDTRQTSATRGDNTPQVIFQETVRGGAVSGSTCITFNVDHGPDGGDIQFPPVPDDASPIFGYLYFQYLSNTNCSVDTLPVFADATINGININTLPLIEVGCINADACFGQAATHFYRVDVSTLFQECDLNIATFELRNFGQGNSTGSSWVEGATMMVAYCSESSPSTDIILVEHPQVMPEDTGSIVYSWDGFNANGDFASLVLGIGNGQEATETVKFTTPSSGETVLGIASNDGLFDGDCGGEPSSGGFYDNTVLDISDLINAGDTTATFQIDATSDCLDSNAAFLTVSSQSAAAPCRPEACIISRCDVICEPPPGSFFPIGDTEVVCHTELRDQSTRTTASVEVCEFTVTVTDECLDNVD